jgi:MFS family permease
LTVFVNPPLGLLVDKYGRRTQLLIGSTLSLICAHFLIYSGSMGALLPLLMIGMAYSVFGSVIWPCVPVVVEESLHGTTYGTMAAFQNIGQFIMPLVLQQIYRSTQLFRPCELFLMATAGCALACALWLHKIDTQHFRGILQKPSAETVVR